MEIRVGNRIAEVELISKVGNCVRMSIDGKVLDLDVMMAENGVCSILMDGVSYNAELIRAEGGKSYTVNTAFALCRWRFWMRRPSCCLPGERRGRDRRTGLSLSCRERS